MSSPQPPEDNSPGDTSHHANRWVERLTHTWPFRTLGHLPLSKIFLSTLFVGAATAAIILMAALFIHWDNRRDSAVESGQADTRAAAAFMDRQLKEIQAVALHLGLFDLTEERFDAGESIEARLKYFLEQNPGFWGVGVCYEPDRRLALALTALNEGLRETYDAQNPPSEDPFDPADGYCPYWTRPGGEVTLTPVLYRYWDPDLFLPGADQPRGTWYQRHIQAGEPAWNPPYFGTTSQRMVAEYVVPFFLPGSDRAAGAVFVNFTLDQISQSVSWLNLGGKGYGLVAAQDECGSYVAHPNPDYFADPERIAVKKPQPTMCEIAGTFDLPELREVLANRHQGGFVHYDDEVTGRDSWLFYEPVEATDWILGSVVIKSEALARDTTAHHLLMWIGIAGLISLFAFIALLLRILRKRGWFSWSVLISFALVCFLGIGYIWFLARTVPEVESAIGSDGQTLTEIVDGYRDRVRADTQAGNLTEAFVGVSVNSVRDIGGGDLIVSGIVWQIFEDELAEDGCEEDGASPATAQVKDMIGDLAEDDQGSPPTECGDTTVENDENVPGFVLADEIGRTALVERFDIRNGKERIVGWSFDTTIAGPSDVSKFPFDRGVIRLPLSPQVIDTPIIFIPDLPAYGVTAPSETPGVGDSFDLSGWNLELSYFSYETKLTDGDLGRPDSSVREDEPQLFFNILLERDSFDPFASRMLPVIVVSILVFALFLIVSRTRSRPDQFPPSTGVTSLSFLSALLFVLILSHNSLRSSLDASAIIYLENFYLIMYIAILGVAIRVISFLYGFRIGEPYDSEEITVERIYWPIVTFAMLAATWFAFY